MNLNKYCLTAFFALSVFLGVNQGVQASNDELAVSKSFKEKGVNGLCKKASLFGGVFSLRSFEGRACSIKYIGALAEKICPGIEKYEDSGCHKKAVAALNGQDPTDALKEAVQKGAGPAKNLICPNINKLPAAVSSKLTPVCG
jgi:hypothetical protein